MLKTFFKTLSFAAVLSASLASLPAHAEQKSDFKVCWSIYVGWMPWGYLQDSGIMKKWADKYDISVDIVQINDYVESINQYTLPPSRGKTSIWLNFPSPITCWRVHLKRSACPNRTSRS